MAQILDLFGYRQDEKLPGGAMCQRFGEPPFTVLDARAGRWQDRKRDWVALGIESELGRGVAGGKCTSGSNSVMLEAARGGLTFKGAAASFDYYRVKEGTRESSQVSSTSIFDPVLCELVYSWFMPQRSSMGILDPFAGGSVRGIVAARLGYQYTGIDLRFEQTQANYLQACAIPCDPKPHWITGDSAQIEALVGDEYDLLFTCPPYWNLERYSDDPHDLSTCDRWDDFCSKYSAIMFKAARRLKSNRFAVVVCGNIRGEDGFLRDMRPVTQAAMKEAGFLFYNDFILVTPVGSLPLRVNGQFSKGRKAGSSHQYVQVFFWGNPEGIKQDFEEL